MHGVRGFPVAVAFMLHNTTYIKTRTKFKFGVLLHLLSSIYSCFLVAVLNNNLVLTGKVFYVKHHILSSTHTGLLSTPFLYVLGV